MSAVTEFWSRFLASEAARGIAEPELYGTFAVGSSAEDADTGAKLILEGRKTATSSLLGDFEEPPFAGALSVLLDGSKQPVAVVETLEVSERKLDELDDVFARDYGEWDRTLATLKSELGAYYGSRDALLLCERFRVIYRED